MADKNKVHASPILRKKSPLQEFKDNVLGTPLTVLPTTKLPTKQIILRRFFGIKQSKKLKTNNSNFSDRETADLIIKELIPIWQKAALPIIREDKIKSHILKQVYNLQSKLKCWKSYGEGSSQVETYKLSIQALFDISVTTSLHQRPTKTGKRTFSFISIKRRYLK